MKRLALTEENEAKVAQEVIELLDQGFVFVCPTDTVYGLVADATNPKAVEKIFQKKGRASDKPISVFVADMVSVKKLARVNARQEAYMENVWPGKFTVIVESKHILSEGFEKDVKIGLRIPDSRFLGLLLREYCKPLTGTSANISGMPSCSESQEVIKQFENQALSPDALIDGGVLPISKESTVVDITGNAPKIVRA